MSKQETLEKIKKAEEFYRTQIEKAKQKRDMMIAETRKKTRDLIEKELEKLKKDYETKLAEEKKKIEFEVSKIVREAEIRAEGLHEKIEFKKPDTKKYIMMLLEGSI